MTSARAVEKLLATLEVLLPPGLGELAMEDRFRRAGLERFRRRGVSPCAA